MTDRLTLTRALEDSGMQSEAAERIATEIYNAIADNVATKQDLEALGAALRADMREMEQRIIIRLGGLVVVVAGLSWIAAGSPASIGAADAWRALWGRKPGDFSGIVSPFPPSGARPKAGAQSRPRASDHSLERDRPMATTSIAKAGRPR